MAKTLGTITLPFIDRGTHAECRYCHTQITIPVGVSNVEAKLIDGWFDLRFVDRGGRMLSGHGCSAP